MVLSFQSGSGIALTLESFMMPNCVDVLQI